VSLRSRRGRPGTRVSGCTNNYSDNKDVAKISDPVTGKWAPVAAAPEGSKKIGGARLPGRSTLGIGMLAVFH
jgi:hypothetical protein